VTVAGHLRAPRVRLQAAATAAAAAAGVALGLVLTPDESRSPLPVPERPAAVATNGVARLPLPDGWARLDRAPAIPGLEGATALRARSSVAALDFRAPEHSSLLPAATVAALGGQLPVPTLQRFGKRQAVGYQLPFSIGERRISALALPTDRGVVTVACKGRQDALFAPESDCDEALQALELAGATPLAAVPESAAAIVLTETVAALDKRRGAAREALASASTPRPRAAAARGVGAAYAAAAARLQPIAAGAAVPLTAELDALARDYGALAAASRRRRPRAASRAGRSIERRERRLPARLAAVHRAAPPITG
jgi:hypothetical protein